MNSKIISQQKNPFLEREEITIEIKNPNTPTAEEVRTAIAKDPTLTVIKKINTNFGAQTFTAEALVYNNIKAKNKIETTPQKIRKKMEADEKATAEAKKKAEVEEAKAKEEPEPKPEESKPEKHKPETQPEEPVQETKSKEPKPEEKQNE